MSTYSEAPLDGDEEMWSLVTHCRKDDGPDQEVHTKLPRSVLSFLIFMDMKGQLGYRSRDYLYYAKRTGNAEAQLVELNFRSDADDMLNFAQSEKRLRFWLSRHAEDEDRPVNITPLKRPRARDCGNQSQGEESDDDDEGFPDDYESLNAYKEWLKDKGEDTGINTLFVIHQPHAIVIVLLAY